MATDAPSKPKGKGLNGKIGPVPVKLALFVVVALAVYLYLRHRAKAAPSSAGSESTPAATDSGLTNLPLPDSTGGGSSGSSGGDGAQTPSGDQFAPPPAVPFNFYFNTVPPDAGGGNTSTPTVPSGNTATQPATSFPRATNFPIVQTNDLASALSIAPSTPNYSYTVPVNKPTASSPGITTGPPAGKRASSNKKQGVYTIH